jgi:hypothetical protein
VGAEGETWIRVKQEGATCGCERKIMMKALEGQGHTQTHTNTQPYTPGPRTFGEGGRREQVAR